jgi:hypothetical protein
MKVEHACSAVFHALSFVVKTEVKECHNREQVGKTRDTASCEKAFRCHVACERFLPLCHSWGPLNTPHIFLFVAIKTVIPVIFSQVKVVVFVIIIPHMLV